LKALLDRYLGFLVSKKLFVFLISTAVMLWSDPNPVIFEIWAYIAIIYLFGQSVIDGIGKLRGN